jgi:hypothetical protein
MKKIKKCRAEGPLMVRCSLAANHTGWHEHRGHSWEKSPSDDKVMTLIRRSRKQALLN